jgi:membrane associated rhomboid family serine protease
VPATAAGRRARCPKCEHIFVVESPANAPAAAKGETKGEVSIVYLTVSCECGKRLRLPWFRDGRPARCPGCQRIMRVLGSAGAGTPASATGCVLIHSEAEHSEELAFLAGSKPIGVGKASDNALALPGTRVSRHHCCLTPFAGGWRVEDRNSTNGLFLNAKRVHSHDLKDGDRLRIGEFQLIYRALGPTPDGRPAAAESKVSASEDADDGTYGIADDFGFMEGLSAGDKVATVPIPQDTSVGDARGRSDGPQSGGATCPCCTRALPASAQVCVDCGINIRTGRSILTSEDTSLDETYSMAEGLIRWLSWIVWAGVYPIASEAFGTRKPLVIRCVAVVTIITSLAFLACEWSGSSKMWSAKNYMLWSGKEEPPPEYLAAMYTFTDFGNSEAFFEHYDSIEDTDPDMSDEDAVLAAHNALPPDERCLGQYRASQLVTHAFLHAGLLHLAGNLLFLMVFGSRVNALIGNALTLALYPLLAVGAAVCHMASQTPEPPFPMLGASGAIMGLAGMYLVLFPLHKVHMAAWLRWGLIGGFRLSLGMWAVRGFWVVLFYIAFDVFYTALGVKDGTAHWAHLGGFIVGASLAMALLLARLVRARGGDIVSAVLGRYAWAILGPPNQDPGVLQRLP